MNFEELINNARKVKAPNLTEGKMSRESGSENDKSIVDQLKAVDFKTRRGIRFIQITYVFLILFLICFLVAAVNSSVKIGVGLIAIAFLLVVFVQQLRYWRYNYSYSSNSIKEFLNKAKNRMRVFTSRTWFVIPIWVLIDVGLCLIINEIFPFPKYNLLIIMLLQVFLLLAIILDFYSAYLFWKKEHKPVIVEIEKMLEEIEN